VRFIHIIDEQEKLVAQADNSLGEQPAGGDWSEAVRIDLPTELSPGDYRVYTGWYAYPNTKPFAIVSDVPDAASGSLEIGRFSIR
jgi:hypothetical protein